MTIREKAKQGLPIDDYLIIDSHNHLGRWGAFYVPQGGTIEQMVASMDRLGIDKVCITAMASIGPDYFYGNNMVFEALRKYPDRVIGYVTVNPNYPEDMQHELDRCFANDGFKAIKIHAGCHSYPIDGLNYKAAYEEADRRGCAVLIHVWGDSDVEAFERVASAYTNAKFTMGHCGGNLSCLPRAIEVISKYDNVHGDLAVSMAPEGNLEWLVKQVGSKKILFGTDMPFYDPRPTLARVAMARISDQEKADILGLNMAAILKL
jgi:predicted TIM-barrel fold metal-dependent hydrolase